MRCALLALALVAVVASAASPAHARELPPEVRRMAERAFLEGRLDDLDVILAGAVEPVDVFPLLLRDHVWRRRSPADVLEMDGYHLGSRRLAWLLADEPEGPYPQAESGGDPYPILTALVLDRHRRETQGHTGLPQDGPLEALAQTLDPASEGRARWFAGDWTRRLMSLTYREPPPHPDRVQRERDAEDLRVRNGRWALIAVGAFLLLAVLTGVWIDRLGRKAPQGDA
jgi:hypothetical protein